MAVLFFGVVLGAGACRSCSKIEDRFRGWKEGLDLVFRWREEAGLCPVLGSVVSRLLPTCCVLFVTIDRSQRGVFV